MAGPSKTRIDHLLVERGLAESRERAQALILAGYVLVNGQKAAKPGHSVAIDAAIEVTERMPYVSRGGYKLAGALDHWNLDVTGKTCLDVGASTGGFTDCLLQRGAAKVWAIDVGHGQFDWKLRNDPRVVVREGLNARGLSNSEVPHRVIRATQHVLPTWYAMIASLQGLGGFVKRASRVPWIRPRAWLEAVRLHQLGIGSLLGVGKI